jgi:hypothetical protein
MSELDEKLQALHKAQQDLYTYLGVTRREADDAGEFQRAKFYPHSTGLSDITVPYPEVLDYRKNKWRIADSHAGRGQEEIQIMPLDIADWQTDWESERVIHFHIYTIKNGDEGLIYAIGNHLPKPHELEYGFPDDVARVEAGDVFFGDRCFLLLDPATGFTELQEYQGYFG